MKKLFLASLLSVTLGSFAVLADDITGFISESGCGAKHNAPSAANTACINKCLKGGSDPVLVSNGKVMQFDADSKAKAKSFAGENVKIDGTINAGTVTITGIEKAQ